MKVCSKCGEEKPFSEFWVSRKGRTKDGYVGRCKECSKRARREWAAKNRDKESTYNRAKNQANPERAREQAKKWRKENPERYAELHRDKEAARRARKRKAFVEYVRASVLLERDDGICGICEEPLGKDYHIDHIIPLVKGGMHSYANTRLTHPRCNLVKGAN